MNAIRQNNIHPYQDHVDRMWNIVTLYSRAYRMGFWMETIDLLYILLECGLRMLLTSKAGINKNPMTRVKIDKQQYLIQLAKLAKDNVFIDDYLYEKIKIFNRSRADAIHGLIQGKITYQELEKVCKYYSSLQGEIQDKWLTITVGKEESRKDVLGY